MRALTLVAGIVVLLVGQAAAQTGQLDQAAPARPADQQTPPPAPPAEEPNIAPARANP